MGKLNLPGKMNRMLEDYINGLLRIYDDNLISVTLYGSAASGEYTNAFSNINLLVILNDTSLANIAKASGLIKKYKFRLIRPVFFTEKFMRNSADVFPIEFLDMKENRIVLHGRDVLRDIEIDVKNLRFQCEQELKSKLINIKNSYMADTSLAGRKKLLFKFFTSILHILRNVLRLKGRVPPYSKEDIISNIVREFENVDEVIFRKILEIKNSNLKLNRRELEDVFYSFVAELEKIADMVDGF